MNKLWGKTLYKIELTIFCVKFSIANILPIFVLYYIGQGCLVPKSPKNLGNFLGINMCPGFVVAIITTLGSHE